MQSYSKGGSLSLENNPCIDSAVVASMISSRIDIPAHVQDFPAMSSNPGYLSLTRVTFSRPYFIGETSDIQQHCVNSKAMAQIMPIPSCHRCPSADSPTLLLRMRGIPDPRHALNIGGQACSKHLASHHSSSALYQHRRHRGWIIARVGARWRRDSRDAMRQRSITYPCLQ